MDDGWSAETLGRLRVPLAIASMIVLVLAVGLPPSHSPTATEPGCRPSADDTVSEGVSLSAIRIASTVTLDGPGGSLLAEAPVGMRAVTNRINRAGGICGRRVELTTVNDSWDRERGHKILRGFVSDGYFALVGLPASEGLVAALEQGDIDKAGIPVVGTGGMTDAEFASPWVWPVGTATSAVMRRIAQDASARGATRFAVVRAAAHQFAQDGAAALRAQVERLGGRITAQVLLDPADTDLADETRQFARACGDAARRCDAVVLLLAPSTALAWRAANPGRTAGRARPGGLTYGAPTLFSDRFAVECAQWCDGMIVPAAYHPAIPPMDAWPGVARFVQHLRAERLGIDVRSQAVQQAYLGMEVFMEAVRFCSPDVTRSCLRRTLNQTTFSTDLAPPLRWREGDRHANTSVTAYMIRTSGESFTGWVPLPGR